MTTPAIPEGDGVQPPIPAPPTNAAPAPAPPVDEGLRFTREALDQRLTRERNKAQADVLKSMGFDSQEKYDEWKASYDESEAAKVQAEREKLSEIERYKAELADSAKALSEAKAANEVAQAQVEAAKIEAHLNALFAQNKISNSSYGMFKFEEKIKGLASGEELNEQEFINELLADPREAIALGVADPNAPPMKIPATTAPSKDGPAPKAPGAETAKHASEMTADEWTAFKHNNHIS